jgi:hypothetical protein
MATTSHKTSHDTPDKSSHKIRIKAPRERVFKALSTAEGPNSKATLPRDGKRSSASPAGSRFAGGSPSSRLTRASAGNASRAPGLRLE